jgi:MFS family permease
LTGGLVAYAAVVGSLSFVTHPVALSFWSFPLGAAGGFVAPLPTAVIADRVPPPLQGLAIGWLRTMTDSGQIVGPLLMGACADAVRLSAPVHLGAVLLTAAAWVLVVTVHPDDPEFDHVLLPG